MGFVKNDGVPKSKEASGLLPASSLESRAGSRMAGDWFQRVRRQLDQAEQRYRERREPRHSVVHKLKDERRSPLEVDSPERVHARLRRLGIESRGVAGAPPPAPPPPSGPGALGYERGVGGSDLTRRGFLGGGVEGAGHGG